MREHLVQHPDGLWRFRYCQSAVVSMYGELTTPPPPPETLRVPTLLVHAGEFGLVREDQIDAYRVALGDNIDVVEVPGGHMVYWDAYEQTAAAVERFLEDSRPGADSAAPIRGRAGFARAADQPTLSVENPLEPLQDSRP